MARTKLLFMGSPEFAVPSIEKIHKNHPEFEFVIITRPDKPKGRGKQLSSTPIKKWGLANNIQVYTPETKEKLVSSVKEIDPSLLIVIAYGLILPSEIVSNYLCINSHASLLPKYRGASPIHAALLNLDKETGVSLIKMNEKMDEGDIILKESIEIKESDNFESIHNKLSELSAQLCLNVIQQHQENRLQFTPQDSNKASYCKKITPTDLELTSDMSKKTILGKIKAFSPKPGAYIEKSGKKTKIIDAIKKQNDIIPTLVKPEGKGIMTYKDYLLGHPEGIKLC